MPASLLDPDYQFGTSPLPGGGPTDLLGQPLQVQGTPPDTGTDQGAALGQTYQMISDAMAKARDQWPSVEEQRGLLAPLPGWKGTAVDAAKQWAEGVMMGTTAPGDVPPPGIVAYHGSPHSFDQLDNSKLHPDEAGHYVTQDEKLAQDYAGRSARDPTAGHMYEVNLKADPAQFLDYGSMKPEEQAALNDPGAVQKLRDAGVPGITFPGGTHVVFDAATIDILRKYGIAGLIAGGGAAATQRQSNSQ